MTTPTPDHEPRSRFEDEGIPDLQDGTPEQQWAEDPQEMPLPGDRPVAVDEHGTTVDEQLEGESLDRRLAREQPDSGADVDPLANVRVDEQDDDLDPSEREVGRLVEQDEGAHPDTEPEAVGQDLGGDTGGLTAEEQAMHVSDEERVVLREGADTEGR